MSTSGSIVPYNFARLHNGSCCRSQTIILNPNRILVVSNQNMKCHFPADQSLRIPSASLGVQNASNMKMNVVVYSGVHPGPPLPSDPSSPGSWKFWILGMIISAVLPFWRNKWGPLQYLKNEIENVVETAENVTDIVEKVAEEVEKVAEELADQLPEGGKLKSAITSVENLAKETAEVAHQAEEVIEKVEELEKEVESLTEPVASHQSNKQEEVVESLIEPVATDQSNKQEPPIQGRL